MQKTNKCVCAAYVLYTSGTTHAFSIINIPSFNKLFLFCLFALPSGSRPVLVFFLPTVKMKVTVEIVSIMEIMEIIAIMEIMDIMEIIATMEIMEITEITEITEIMAITEIMEITDDMDDNFDFVCVSLCLYNYL